MKIVIASKNPVKINAALSGFLKMFPNEKFEAEGIAVLTGVSEQPENDTETYTGAWNRAETASQEISADYWVGIEGGIERKESGMEVFAWIVIKSLEGKFGKARTGTFFLPFQMAELINQGKELGEVDDIVFGRTNSKQGNGTVGALTGDVIDRTQYYIEAVVLALIPFKNNNLY
jgi:inosine/xanthosine triphosphatase